MVNPLDDHLVWDRDGIRLYHSELDVAIPFLPEVDHVLTDPPFAAQTHRGARTLAGRSTRKEAGAELVTFDAITPEALATFTALVMSRTRRWFIATVDQRHVPALWDGHEGIYRFIRYGAWVKRNPTPQLTGDRPAQGWESVVILHRNPSPELMRWNGGGHAAVWHTRPVRKSQYPTEKPYELIRQWVEAFTDPGDLILDPFCGSGTTLVVARDLGRRAIGIDRDRKAIDVALTRLALRPRDPDEHADQGTLQWGD